MKRMIHMADRAEVSEIVSCGVKRFWECPTSLDY